MSIHGQYDPDNIFAKILRGDMPCVRVFEDEHTLAFMDVFPQTRGHMLVIHKTETARNLMDVSALGLTQIMATVQRLTSAAKTALKPDGIVVTQFNGAPAGQTVFHLHVHIIPRYEGVQTAPHASGKMADMDALTALAANISAAITNN